MPLAVRLAGYNLDADLIQEVLEVLRTVEGNRPSIPWDANESGASQASGVYIPVAVLARLSPEAFTPETISAAYARISRDPRQVSDLRKAARQSVARSRKSNENIIFGLGHSSVAEHACFNFDITGLSRLASEELQSHRLISFTEKSQRYISISPDYVVPPELRSSPWEEAFGDLVPKMFADYERMANSLQAAMQRSGAFGNDPERDRKLEYVAKEDARYLLPLCCTTQMGVTMNARNVEHVICELSDHPLEELRQLGREIARAVSGLAPSLVKYISRGRYPRLSRAAFAASCAFPSAEKQAETIHAPRVQLKEHTPRGEEIVLQALGFSLNRVISADDADRRRLWLRILEGMNEHDPAPREFELASMTFEALVSASCFAQLKRHRMMTLLSAPYEAGSEIMCPPTIRDSELSTSFATALQDAAAKAEALGKSHPGLAPYLFTNAHCKRVIIHVNARELYHFARLRCDAHAQWEIRLLAEGMLGYAKGLWPEMMMLACGKDRFTDEYRRLHSQ